MITSISCPLGLVFCLNIAVVVVLKLSYSLAYYTVIQAADIASFPFLSY